ncbi:MAG: hypothetical protein JKX91_15685, partial [Rhizobiaceae bacterium]|nr:hypothetical protein [Rhizobiaceae bacterium]
MEQDFDISLYLNILKQRYVVLIASAVSLFAIASIIVFLLPREYVAEAKILVESQQIPDELARSTVTANASERLQIIKQRLMTRNNLLEIAREFNLYTSDARSLSPSQIVSEMRVAAQIRQIAVGTKRRRTVQSIAFTVSFNYIKPVIAARVANKFVELILEQNIQTRKSRASETRLFFERQLQSHRQALVNLEVRIIKFKNENRDSLPESLNRRLDLFSKIQSAKLEMQRKLDTLIEKKILWTARAKDSLAGVVLDPNANSTFAKLDALRTQLIQLKGVYSERHPEVKRIKGQIRALEKASQQSPPTEEKASDAQVVNLELEGNPSLDPKIASQLALIGRQITSLEKEIVSLDERFKQVGEAINKTSSVDISLNVLLREYANLQRQSQRAEDKKNVAEIGETMEEGRQAERFEVIEQATTPEKPTKPNRPKLMAASFFGSIMASIGLIALLEIASDKVRGGSGLRSKLKITPISTIPYVMTIAERRSRFRRL